MPNTLIGTPWTKYKKTGLTKELYFRWQVPYATRPNHLIIPLAFLGFGIGMVDSSMMPGKIDPGSLKD